MCEIVCLNLNRNDTLAHDDQAACTLQTRWTTQRKKKLSKANQMEWILLAKSSSTFWVKKRTTKNRNNPVDNEINFVSQIIWALYSYFDFRVDLVHNFSVEIVFGYGYSCFSNEDNTTKMPSCWFRKTNLEKVFHTKYECRGTGEGTTSCGANSCKNSRRKQTPKRT